MENCGIGGNKFPWPWSGGGVQEIKQLSHQRTWVRGASATWISFQAQSYIISEYEGMEQGHKRVLLKAGKEENVLAK